MTEKHCRASLTEVHLAVAIERVSGYFIFAKSDIMETWHGIP